MIAAYAGHRLRLLRRRVDVIGSAPRCDEPGGGTMTRKLLRLRLFAAALLMALIAVAAPAITADDTKPAETTKKSPWKADDFVFTENASQFRISPDGKWAVWVKNTADKEKDVRVSNLYLSSLTEKKEIQLTQGEDDVSSPRWSPSGETIAFLSSRALPKPNAKAAHMQLWLMNAGGRRALACDRIRARHQSVRVARQRHDPVQRGGRSLALRARHERAQRR